MSLAGARGCIFPLLVEHVPSPMLCILDFCYFVTEFHNKACVVCESDVVTFSLSNHAIKFI